MILFYGERFKGTAVAAFIRCKLVFIFVNLEKSMDQELSSKLLEILVCPQSKKPLIYDQKQQKLICKESGLSYEIRDNIPILLIDEATKL